MKLSRYEQETIVNLSYFSDKLTYLRNKIIREKSLKVGIFAIFSETFSDNLPASIISNNPDNPARRHPRLFVTKYGKHYNPQDICLSVPD